MTLQEAFDSGFEEVKKYIDAQFAEFDNKIKLIKGEKGDPGEPGAEADPLVIERMVADAVAKVPRPTDGKDGEPGSPGVDGRDGRDADEETILRIVAEEIKKIPQPLDGRDGAPGVDGKDGRDGLPGLAGRDGFNGKDGAPGKDGADGLGFDDMRVEYDGERNLSIVFERGELIKQFDIELPMPIDRGIWKEGEFKRGDTVTWGGSLWIAQKDTVSKPDTPDSDWRLAVKRGRDGKDAKSAPNPRA